MNYWKLKKKKKKKKKKKNKLYKNLIMKNTKYIKNKIYLI